MEGKDHRVVGFRLRSAGTPHGILQSTIWVHRMGRAEFARGLGAIQAKDDPQRGR